MVQEEIQRSGFTGFLTRVLNEAGSAVVVVYDVGSGAVDKVVSTLKKAPDLPEKAKSLFSLGLKVAKPSESKIIEAKIKEREKKIEELYYEIGKEGAKASDAGKTLEDESVKKLISDVREYEKEIQRLTSRVSELEGLERENQRQKEEEKALRKTKFREKARLVKEKAEKKDVHAAKAVKKAIEDALSHGVFEAASERSAFDKIANDLLDSDMEIKILAASELGKMQNEAAVPVLIEAATFGDEYLTSEIMNALINIGDPRAIPLFWEMAVAPYHRVRIASLRGVYKLAKEDDEYVMSLLADALRDEHPDVRRTAATFVGWKDNVGAVPGLVQCLRDDDERVRKAAISALANIRDAASVLPLIGLLGDKSLEMRKRAFDAIKMITGEEIAFDVEASGKALTDAIDKTRDWWQAKRLGDAEIQQPDEAAGVEAEEDVVAEERQAEIERTWAAEEEGAEEEGAEEEDAAEVTEPEAVEPESEEIQLTPDKLIRMLKAELISMCNERGIECDETLTKAEIVDLILGEE